MMTSRQDKVPRSILVQDIPYRPAFHVNDDIANDLLILAHSPAQSQDNIPEAWILPGSRYQYGFLGLRRSGKDSPAIILRQMINMRDIRSRERNMSIC